MKQKKACFCTCGPGVGLSSITLKLSPLANEHLFQIEVQMSLDSCQAYFCCSLGFEQLGKSKGSILSLALVLGLFGGYFVLPDTFFLLFSYNVQRSIQTQITPYDIGKKSIYTS